MRLGSIGHLRLQVTRIKIAAQLTAQQGVTMQKIMDNVRYDILCGIKGWVSFRRGQRGHLPPLGF